MKIQIALCTKDRMYAERFTTYFQKHYSDKFSWNIFSETSYLLRFLISNSVDLILFGEEMEKDSEVELLVDKKQTLLIHLVDDKDVEAEAKALQIGKYSRGDELYREILELYSKQENVRYTAVGNVNVRTEIFYFVSAAGGTGSSAVASAFAKSCGASEKVLYINLETMSAASLLFQEEGKHSIDEVILALKSRRNVLELKLDGSVSRAADGVYFFRESENAFHILELTEEDYKELFATIRKMQEYDKVILDVGNGLGVKEIAAMVYSDKIVVISEENEICEKKLKRYMDSLKVMEITRQADIRSKLVLIYNKIFRQAELPKQSCEIPVIGGIPRLENGTYTEVVRRISEMQILHSI